MSDQVSHPAVRIWKAIVLVVSGLLRAVGAALYFGHWCLGIGLLLGLLVGGVMFATMVDGGSALVVGPMVGSGVGVVVGVLFGLVTGAFFPAFVDRVVKLPMFWDGNRWNG